jgi:hypothetical protein
MGYLEPFDAQTWLGMIIYLLIYSTAMAILVSRSPNTSFIDSILRSFFMNLSFLTGVANVPLKLIVNYRLNSIRILLFSWGITTIVLCSVYSSLVTTNVTSPKLLVSPWTEYKQLEKFTKVFGLNNQKEMSRMDAHDKARKSELRRSYHFARGSKVSRLLFDEMRIKVFAKFKPKGLCDMFSGNSSTCQADRNKFFGFIDSYRYVERSDVEKLKEILAVCTNTAFIDKENSIDDFLHIWSQDEHFPSMVKGSLFFQRSFNWAMSDTWILRKLMSSRMKAFTASGIFGFWERFCLKHCRMQSETSEFHIPVKNLKAGTFKPQKLGSNLTSLFLIKLIISTISILCFVGECLFSLTFKSLTYFGTIVRI